MRVIACNMPPLADTLPLKVMVQEIEKQSYSSVQ